MNEYYGITTPTDDFIAHWGVKGMKWGVRKARPVSNGAPKSLGYRRAERKLAKLEAKANRNALLEKANRLDKVSKGARKVGRVGLGAAVVGTAGASNALHSHLIKKSIDRFNKDVRTTKTAIADPSGRTVTRYSYGVPSSEVNKAQGVYEQRNRVIDKAQNASKYLQAGGAGLAALGYGASIGSKLRANALRRKANDASKMRAARQKAEAYRAQMNAKYGIRRKRK